MVLEVAVLHVRPGQGSPAYPRWRELLHHLYDPFPVVEHYVPVEGAGGAALRA
jgi:hypothetical protein